MLKLYLVQLDSILHNQDYLHALPYANQLQINNYKSEQAKKQKIGSVLLMNYLLNKYRVDVRLLKISEYGKPYVSGNKIHFNISHSDNYLICGVSNYEIGVDIECVNPRLKTIKSMFLSQSEQKTHLHSSDSKLTQIWACKEAIVKMNGIGITQRLNMINLNKTRACVHNIKYKNAMIAIATKNKTPRPKITKIALISLKD